MKGAINLGQTLLLRRGIESLLNAPFGAKSSLDSGVGDLNRKVQDQAKIGPQSVPVDLPDPIWIAIKCLVDE